MRLLHLLFLLFLAVPVIEIYLLIKVGAVLGAIPTIFLVVFTAVLGALLLRHQGFSTLHRAQAALARGELPATMLLEGVVLLLCGALLLTPGFFTDAVGFLGLIAPLRRRAIEAFIARGVVQSTVGRREGERRREGPVVIDGEFRREEDDERR